MANPVQAVWSYLRGDDFKALVPTTPADDTKGVVRPGQEPVPQRKLWYWDDVGAALRLGTLVHGPGATELLGQAWGNFGQDANSAVYACLAAICTAYPEAPLRVYRGDPEGGSTPDVLPDHPFEELLAHPNPNMTGAELWYWTQWAKHVTGNAYWRKVRAGNPDTGNVVQVWPLSPMTVQPVTTPEDRRRGVFISYYKHELEPGKFEAIPPEQLVHFRLGIDDYDHRLGCSPLRRLVKQIGTDDEVDRFTAALLNNGAIPGLVVTTQDPDLTEADAEKIKANLSSKFGGGNRGSVGVLSNGAKAEQFGFSPEQLNLTVLHRIPEERISAVLRVPAIIAGLGAGLDRSTYSNFREAREMFAEMTILPLYTFDAATLTQQLLPDFTSDPAVFARFDLTDVRALQEDEDKKYARLNLGVLGKWIAPNEARADVGLPPIDGGDTIAPPAAPAAPALPDMGNPAGQSGQNRPSGPRASITEVRRGLQALPAVKAAGVSVERFPDLLAAMVDLAAPALERDLADYFESQRRKIKGRLLAHPLDPGTADPATARAALPRAQ